MLHSSSKVNNKLFENKGVSKSGRATFEESKIGLTENLSKVIIDSHEK